MSNNTPNTATAAAGLTENLAGLLCYAFGLISGIAFLVLAPYNANRRLRFHAFQSMFMLAAGFAFFVTLSIVGMVLPSMLSMVLSLASMAAGLGFLGLWLFMMWKTYQGETVVLPVLGPLATQYADR